MIVALCVKERCNSAPSKQLRELDFELRRCYVVQKQSSTLVKIRLQRLFLVWVISMAPMTVPHRLAARTKQYSQLLRRATWLQHYSSLHTGASQSWNLSSVAAMLLLAVICLSLDLTAHVRHGRAVSFPPTKWGRRATAGCACTVSVGVHINISAPEYIIFIHTTSIAIPFP
jgi:hypothetical protein